MNPQDLKYSQEHEWVRLESGNVVSIGITAFAAEELGDVVFVELPDKGAELTQFQQLGEIESVKAVSELFSPIAGRVTERNERVLEKPELVNSSPYDDGWLLKLLADDVMELEKLMSAEQYESFLASRGQ